MTSDTFLDLRSLSLDECVEVIQRCRKRRPIAIFILDRELKILQISFVDQPAAPLSTYVGRCVNELLPHLSPHLESVLSATIETGEAALDFVVTDEQLAIGSGGDGVLCCSLLPLVSGEEEPINVCLVVDENVATSRDGGAERDETYRRIEAEARRRTEELAAANRRLQEEVSERRKTQEALEHSEQRLRLLLETTYVIPWEADGTTWCFTYVGPQAVHLLGYPLADWYEPDFWAVHIHPEDREEAIATCLDLSSRCNEYDFEYRMVGADGRVVWLHDFVSVETGDETVHTLRGFMIDITERKGAEEALKISRAKYLDLYDKAPDMFFSVAASDRKIVECNETLTRKTGWPKEELIGRDVFDLYHPDCARQVRRAARSFRETGVVRDIELTLLCQDGTKLDVSVSVSAVRDKAGRITHGRSVCRDISERKKAQEALRRSEAALRKSQTELRALAGKLLSAQEEERRRLARELHDDLTQRLAGLAIEAGKLEQELWARQHPMGERICAMKDRLVELSVDAHHMSRQLHPSILEDLGLIDAIEAECSRMSEREAIAATFLPKNVPIMLPRDISLCLYRITQESLRNVAKHAQARSATVSLNGVGDALLLSIQDSGVGFDPSKIKDKGLGLASMEERVRLVQGSLSIRSQPGQGTTIEVWAPLTEKVNHDKTTRTIGG